MSDQSVPTHHSFEVSGLAVALALCSLASAAIHFAVMADHFNEYFAFGMFFAVVAWFQAIWAVAIVTFPRRWILTSGLVVNLAVVLVWVVSRTSGLPIGPEPGVAEAASFIDVLSTALEVLVVVGIALILWRPEGAQRSGRSALIVGVALALALVPITTSAIASAGDGESTHGSAAEELGEESVADERDGPQETGVGRVELGDGRFLQTTVDTNDQLSLMHLTFFDEGGQGLAVSNVSITGQSSSGAEVDVPTSRFEDAHWVASASLEPGEWTFRIEADVDAGGQVQGELQTYIE